MLFLGTCYVSACGCPDAFLESWCDETNPDELKLTDNWCEESEPNCVGCGGAWCTVDASGDTKSTSIVILYTKS